MEASVKVTSETAKVSNVNPIKLLEDRLAKKISEKEGVGFDPITIIMIIAALIPLIQNCFNASPKALKKRMLNKARIAAALRREAGWSVTECLQKAEWVMDLADEAEDQELAALIEECRI